MSTLTKPEKKIMKKINKTKNSEPEMQRTHRKRHKENVSNNTEIERGYAKKRNKVEEK